MVNVTSKDNYWRIKKLVLNHYCADDIKCKCCGEKQIESLCIDHVDNDGGKERMLTKASTYQLCKWLVDNDYPVGYQILCYNCNTMKQKNGHGIFCPHHPEIILGKRIEPDEYVSCVRMNGRRFESFTININGAEKEIPMYYFSLMDKNDAEWYWKLFWQYWGSAPPMTVHQFIAIGEKQLEEYNSKSQNDNKCSVPDSNR